MSTKFGISGILDNTLRGDEQVHDQESGGFLRFDFSHLQHLKSIKVEISGPSYYKLNIPGKEDHDLDTPLATPDRVVVKVATTTVVVKSLLILLGYLKMHHLLLRKKLNISNNMQQQIL